MIKQIRTEDRDRQKTIAHPHPAWVTAIDEKTGTMVRVWATPQDQAKAQSFVTKFAEILNETFGTDRASHIENLKGG